MPDVFISYAQEDSDIAAAIAEGLEDEGFSTWRYEADVGAGDDYLLSTRHNIEACKAFLLLASPNGVESDQIDKEVVRAHECRKPFVPVLYRIDYDEFGERQPKWQQAIGSATAVVVPRNGDVGAIMPRLVTGLKRLAGTGQGGRSTRRSTIGWSTRRRIKRALRVTRWLAIVIVVLAAAAGGAWLYLEKRISDAKQLADRFRATNPVKAVENLGWVLSWHPKDAETRLLRARLYLQMSQPLDARSDTDVLLESDPENGEAHFLRGRTLQDEGRYSDAEAEFGRAIAAGWTRKESYYERGHVLRAQGRFEEADRDYTVLIDRGEGDGDVFFYRGLTRVASSDYQAAEADLDKAIDDDPKWGDALSKRAWVRAKRLHDFIQTDGFRAELAGPKSQSLVSFVRAKLEDIQDDVRRALASSSLDSRMREPLGGLQNSVQEFLAGIRSGRTELAFFNEMTGRWTGEGSNPGAGTSGHESLGPAVPTGAPTATIRNVRIQYDAMNRGNSGIIFFSDVGINYARDHACRVAILIRYSNNQPVMSRSADWRNTKGELMTFAEMKPDRDNYVYPEFGVFLPYDQLPRKQRFFNYSMAVVDGAKTISGEVKGQFDGSLVDSGAPRAVIDDPTRQRSPRRAASSDNPGAALETPQALRKAISDAARGGQWRTCIEGLSRLARIDASNRVGVAEIADSVLKRFYELFPADSFTPTSVRESRTGVGKLRGLLLPVAEAGSAYAALLVAESLISYDEECRVDAIDAGQALKWAEAAAGGNLAKGCLYAAQLHGNMDGDVESAKKSVAFLKRGSRLGSADATAMLALRFYQYQYQRDKHPFNPDPLLSDDRQKDRGFELASSVRDRTPSCMCIYAQYCYKRENFQAGREYVAKAARAGHTGARKFCEKEKIPY